MIVNKYISAQAHSIRNALHNSHCPCEAEDYAFEYLSRARKNPSLSMIVEHNVLKNSTKDQNYWNSLKNRWWDAKDKVKTIFNKNYPRTGKLREKLIKNNRIELDYVTSKMDADAKYNFKYPETGDLRKKLIKNNRINADKVTHKMNKLQKILFTYLKKD